MRLWKAGNIWHIATSSLECSDDVLRERDGVELKIGLEKEVDNVVRPPFS